ncbi:MAG: S41 family peptidase [Chitinophagaceae bacterium]|nr:S41 family peptidase [Chitinophagaceae bacterium]
MQLFIKACFCLFPLAAAAQIQPKAILLKRFIEKSHYTPRTVDDNFSMDLFGKMLEDIDPYKIYFDAGNLQKLEPYRNTLDNALNGQPSQFTRELSALYHQAVIKWEKQAASILQKKLNLPTGAAFAYGKNVPFAKDSLALRQRWMQYLQWRILSRVMDKWEYESEDSIDATVPASSSPWFEDAELAARNALSQRIKERITEKEKSGLAETEKMINELYLHAIAQCFDPHTDYFDPDYKKAFSESLSSDVLEFGFALDETEEGDVVVSELKPGSAAWNSGNIYPDDKILQVKTKSGKTVNVKEDGLEALHKVLDETDKEELEITLRSADGNTRQVKLAKQEAQNEENLVRGYLLTGEKRMGYISLPSFYTTWGNSEGSGCANDLSKEIIKLKREKIDGLILDLRYNGGGSLQEAIEIAGIFIEAGPMTIIKGPTGERATLKDPSRGSIYDGPLMVLINGQSASASELVAATLQDYKRAVIMGSPTFGKATMQIVLPLDTNIIAKKSVDEKKYNPENTIPTRSMMIM